MPSQKYYCTVVIVEVKQVFWQNVDFVMNCKRKEYKRKWISNKRKAVLLKKASERVSLSVSSDSSDDAAADTGKPVSVENTLSDSELDVWADEPECSDAWKNIDYECGLQDGLSCSSDSGEEDDMASQLRTWVVEAGVTEAQLNKLLPMLKKSHSNLPLTAATLMKTRKDLQCRPLSGGDYTCILVLTVASKIF